MNIISLTWFFITASFIAMWLNIKEAAEKLGIIEKSIRQDLILLDKKGWIISSGTTSNRTYQLSDQAKELFVG